MIKTVFPIIFLIVLHTTRNTAYNKEHFTKSLISRLVINLLKIWKRRCDHTTFLYPHVLFIIWWEAQFYHCSLLCNICHISEKCNVAIFSGTNIWAPVAQWGNLIDHQWCLESPPGMLASSQNFWNYIPMATLQDTGSVPCCGVAHNKEHFWNLPSKSDMWCDQASSIAIWKN